jgi:HEPN domain-containing protein
MNMSLDEALGIWAEAAQDLSSAGLALAASNYYNCADLANQVAEKSLQSVYVLNHDARATYDHDLRALGALVNAPPDLLEILDLLTPYHPAHFLTDDLPAELADDAVGPDTAEQLLDNARVVLRWARQIVMTAH